MSRRKILFGAVLLVLMTFLATSAGFLYLMNAWSSDVVSTLRVLRALQVVKSRYVEDVSVDTLMAGSIKGMVNSLNDPHSIYMDNKMFKDFMIETEGSFGGVGIVIGTKDKLLTVVAPIEGTPGEKAGIKSGDQIIKIDGQDTKDLALDEAVNKIRGPEGSKVVLTIKRGEDTQDYTLTRSNIQIKTVAGKMMDNHIGYIRISMFNENTGDDFIHKLQELEKQGMKAIVLDLRDNPGGLLNESVEVASQLVPKGPVVSVVTRDGQRETHSSNLAVPKYPVAVLVNGGSASASEIVAGAVQDTGVGTLIGTKTYGKGSVQTVIRLDEASAVKLTIAKYLTPKDRSINGVGIEPDITIELPETKDKDVQLEKALEVLQSKL
ncbi:MULTISPECIES: S41 family peptidase [Sporomusa]|uniref:Carboxy-terminal processing protease CtpB n=1 Tax=Sporomusa sphaeroides DSM 2875 TaxID=1337886 RepID=A0ABM9W2U3_9FIRM|nr:MULTISPECIES: S41 family peptidase [Sporomusa]MCM0758968.1 S41 family peptidase [Sporomusa sphaeroides DSM 2875]OLS55043.1 carboxy-terminal processing protease CtpB precursor [Sporomusa sphaeroides DSM 2875]CVK19489.1 Carboxy-terminal processing protease CtpB precursor [Sporomusa sphaeroides DSM 2875]HML32374.1 S41 family peptidase [Sporomusa sphaeroides]